MQQETFYLWANAGASPNFAHSTMNIHSTQQLHLSKVDIEYEASTLKLYIMCGKQKCEQGRESNKVGTERASRVQSAEASRSKVNWHC
jgi:hypothetical protein